VIYLHVDGPPVEIAVDVGIPGGRILEVLPSAQVSDDRHALRWPALVVGGPSCASSVRARASDPECTTPDGYCEAVEDPEYDTRDASCIRVPGGATRNHLLYRGEVPRSALPLSVTLAEPSRRAAPFAVSSASLHNVGRSATSGAILRVSRLADETLGLTRYDDPVAPGATIALRAPGPPDAASPDAVREALRALVASRGLTAPEIDAFDRAWAPLVAGVRVSRDQAVTQAPIKPARDAIYYVLSDETANALFPIRIAGAQATLRRALVVRIEMSP
jgi:hypothetical protein